MINQEHTADLHHRGCDTDSKHTVDRKSHLLILCTPEYTTSSLLVYLAHLLPLHRHLKVHGAEVRMYRMRNESSSYAQYSRHFHEGLLKVQKRITKFWLCTKCTFCESDKNNSLKDVS